MAIDELDDELDALHDELADMLANGALSLKPASRWRSSLGSTSASRPRAAHLGTRGVSRWSSARLKSPIGCGFDSFPSTIAFFDLFNAAAGNAAECAKHLRKLIADDAAEVFKRRVVACEHRGDELTAEILKRLNTSFVTPFDREDIHALAEELDDVRRRHAAVAPAFD